MSPERIAELRAKIAANKKYHGASTGEFGVVAECLDAVEALQRENKQLRAQLEHYRKSLLAIAAPGHSFTREDLIEEALCCLRGKP